MCSYRNDRGAAFLYLMCIFVFITGILLLINATSCQPGSCIITMFCTAQWPQHLPAYRMCVYHQPPHSESILSPQWWALTISIRERSPIVSLMMAVSVKMFSVWLFPMSTLGVYIWKCKTPRKSMAEGVALWFGWLVLYVLLCELCVGVRL